MTIWRPSVWTPAVVRHPGRIRRYESTLELFDDGWVVFSYGRCWTSWGALRRARRALPGVI